MWEYLTFQGTLRRAPYIWRALVSLATMLLPLFVVLVANENGSSQEVIIPLGFIAAVCLILGSWCSIATECRRWRDMGLSPWWFLGRCLIGWIVSALLGSGAGGFFNLAAVIVLASIPTAHFLSKNLTAENT